MQQNLLHIKKLLDSEVLKRDNSYELSSKAPADPLRVAKPYKDDIIALVCALFAYGNARLIERFLLCLDFNILDDERMIEKALEGKYYRFQTDKDVVEIFKTLSYLKKECSLEELFFRGYKEEESVIDGLRVVIEKLYSLNPYRSRGYEFLLGKIPEKKIDSPYKRYNMFLRWMVRDDNLDMGLWKRVHKQSLLMPLDVHTFKVSRALGLLERKTYDFKAVMELTNTLKTFDKNDPIKYDFAIYRLGQSRQIEEFMKKTHS